MTSSVTCWLFRNVLFNLCVCVSYSFFFLSLISSLIALWLQKILDTISVLLNLLRFDLSPKVWSVLENIPCVLEKKVYYSAFGWNILKISMKSISSNVSFKPHVSLLIFCFYDLSIGVNVVLKSPTIIVLLSVSHFCLLVFVLCIEALLFGCIDIYNFYVFLLDWSLDSLSHEYFLFKGLFCLIWGLLLQLSFVSHLHAIYLSILWFSVYMCL